MTLRTKTLLMVAGTNAVFVATLAAVSLTVILRGYADLEREYLRRNVSRAADALRREIDSLAATNRDYAFWDDACEFVVRRNEDFIEANFTPQGQANTRVDIVLICDEAGKVIFSRAFEHAQGIEVPVLPGLLEYVTTDLRLTFHPDGACTHQGIAVLPELPVLLSSAPILTSTHEGPVRGSMIFGRRCDEAWIRELSATTHLSLELEPAAGLSVSPAGVEPGDPNVIVARTFVEDLTGRGGVVLKVQMPRDIYRAGLATILRFLGAMAGMALTVSLAGLWMIERLVLQRLARFERTVREITAADSLAARLPALGDDELGRLAHSINTMLNVIAGSRQELEAQQQQLKAQQAELVAINRELEEAWNRADHASKAKTQFLANMSHEIRTPMTAIMGFAEMMMDPAQPEAERLDCVRTIRRNSQHLLELINDILDLSKIESGKFSVERIPCPPLAVVAEVESSMRVRAASKGLEFAVIYRTAVPETVTTDPMRLRQVLNNLVSNAIKFTERGSVRLEVGFVENPSPCAGGLLRFEVMDTGIGMTPEQMQKLFQPFQQADESMSRRFGGTGLGLSISKRLVEEMGGSISVESTPGAGSRFTFHIPTGPLEGVRLIRPDEAAQAADPGRLPPVPVSGVAEGSLEARILVAEDGPDNQRLITFLLRKAGAEVELAGNGREAVELALKSVAEGRPFDAILMDIQMPEMDGYEATQTLRTRGYDGVIIALTAHAMLSDQLKCFRAGCNGYATKPINHSGLIATIRQHLEKRSPAGASV